MTRAFRHGNSLTRGRLLDELPTDQAAAGAERFDRLIQNPSVEIERIVSYGHASAPGFWYDQARSEWVVVVSGRAGLEIEGESQTLELGPGDWVELPAHCRHRVAWTASDEPTVWLAVHY